MADRDHLLEGCVQAQSRGLHAEQQAGDQAQGNHQSPVVEQQAFSQTSGISVERQQDTRVLRLMGHHFTVHCLGSVMRVSRVSRTRPLALARITCPSALVVSPLR
ncbi:hypothetical protein D9M68_960330 [compost metagenome]